MIDRSKLVEPEQRELDRVLVDPEGLLASSLIADDRHRKHRMLWLGGLGLFCFDVHIHGRVNFGSGRGRYI
ncbi:MAG: hypothetical protein ABGZ53_34735 [Fuerstiella sp.]